MSQPSTNLRISGEVQQECVLTYDDLRAIPQEFQVADFATIVPNRPGLALRLEGLLQVAKVKETAKYLGLHGSHDDFHASIPLAEVRDRGYVIYGQDDGPLPLEKGGPVRFFIPDHAQCKMDEIDECANVKFVDHMELTQAKGFDNRPTDEEAHARLHGHG